MGQPKDSEAILHDVLDCLNTAFTADPVAMHCLICNRVPVNEELAGHPHVVVSSPPIQGEVYTVGMLGVICGILHAAGLPTVAAHWSELDSQGQRKLLGFVKYTEPEQPIPSQA